ncbi:MAG: helix-turn-helix transcriptional regulator [Deltaproteobacteria bacterium]|nr:helix-turn-helix transcriptional regulator [Deltaproteobacteria bacterium]
MAGRKDSGRKAPDSTKSAILRAARQHFARRGYHATSIRDIAGEVGIDVKTLYYHWQSKQTLFEAALADVQRSFEESLRQWFAETSELGLRESVFGLLDRLVPFLLAEEAAVARITLFSMVDFGIDGAVWDVHYMPTFINTLRKFVQKRTGIKSLPKDFDLLVINVMSLMTTLSSMRDFQAKLHVVAPDSPAFVELMRQSARMAVEPYLSLLEPRTPQ